MRTPRVSASQREAGANRRPASDIDPEAGVSSPHRILDRVLLPAPFSPVKASTSPA